MQYGNIMRFIIVSTFCLLCVFVLHANILLQAKELPRFPQLESSVLETEEEEYLDDTSAEKPFPPALLPKRLLERPRGAEKLMPPVRHSATKQTAFDNPNPAGSIIPESLLENDATDQSVDVPLYPQGRRGLPQRQQQVVMEDGSYYTANHRQRQGVADNTALSADMTGSADDTAVLPNYYPVPVMPAFGMGTLDNLQLFTSSQTFKNVLSQGSGSFAVSEGLNWSTPVGAAGAATAQFGVRANQANLHDNNLGRNQIFMTAGVFKRFEGKPLQAGAAFDWIDDRVESLSDKHTYKFKQLRTEISMRSFRGFEYGFQGGFNMDEKKTDIVVAKQAVVQDYYLLFARYLLPSGGQVEGNVGATEWGDIVLGINGQAAVSSRLAVTGGVSVLSPHEGRSANGNMRESWSLSLGLIFYFRGGADNFANNENRPLFDVAGNGSTFLIMK
ncbi:MAG: hypothetical protein LBT46_13355 [Planctomycetaceae bacterium]|nr:hypothetical protein [Planctomycetaceae bacterium]